MKYLCGTCGREFKSLASLGSHNFYVHGRASEKRKPLRRFITDLEIIELFKTRDASMTTVRQGILDLSQRNLKLLSEIGRIDGEMFALQKSVLDLGKRSDALLAEIGRLDAELSRSNREIAELRPVRVKTKV